MLVICFLYYFYSIFYNYFADSLHCFTCINLMNDADCSHVNQCATNEVITSLCVYVCVCECACVRVLSPCTTEREREGERGEREYRKAEHVTLLNKTIK